ncbi:MAG: hypothetical protein KKB62_01615 [Nanoarchaeota archaeon]|nr:hypothetical protein [Nanoarchaeota archaeon]
MKKDLEKNIECQEDSIKKKIKEKGSIIGMIGLGALGFIHALSHVIPAIGAFGMSQLETHNEAISVFGYNIEPIVTHPVMQIAYLAFVPLSFYWIYRDHKHHQHEREVRKELLKTKKELEELKSNYKN